MRLLKYISPINLSKTRSFKFSGTLTGGALYVAIMVSIIIGIILSMFILIANYNQRNVVSYTQSVQLNYNLLSAFQLAQSSYFTEQQNNIWFKNTGNDDSIRIKKSYWGAYLLISAETKNRHHYLSQSGIYGTYMTADTGLMVSDNSRPVGLSGNIIFKANCYLPKAGIKPAYIEGQSYQGSSQNTAFIRNSPLLINSPENSFVNGIEQQYKINLSLDSVVSELPKIFSNSFSKKTVLWETNQSKFSGLSLKNNIKIVGNEIEVDSTCHLDNVLIVCNKIHFNDGFRGKIHVIARDSIITSKGCVFNYPSSFVLTTTGESSNALNYIQLNEKCVFYGGMVALNKTNLNTVGQKVFIKLNALSEVNGFIYSGDYLHLEGKVNATVITNKLLLKTPSAVYENHLLACEINPAKYSHLMAVPSIFKQSGKLLCCLKTN